ncbi:head fiber protein [Microbacterium sp. zg-YB36]|uniref:head fiber protein n=1 Tax=Microbacterium sp. zg-YB36 TaxID=2969407 RepID=UPI00214BCCCE|nr:head fiber protein [Microbacterium sp. zg-YB36]MDL5351211.1 head fiber protein [Microbacterium sp. zg-YB36]
MPNPKPISLVAGANPSPLVDPQEFVLVGPLPAATATVNGGVKRAAAQANSTATDVAGLVADFNALLAKLRTAGVIAP